MTTQESRFPGIVFVAFAALLCFARFRLGNLPLVTYDDDFFYYLRASRNLLATGRCTFDGVRLTNGFHPLWFAVVTLVGACTSARWFFAGLQLVEFALALATYPLLRSSLRRHCTQPLAADCATLVACSLGVALARGGMEIALVFPLAAALLRYRFGVGFLWRPHQAVVYGLLLSLLVLARLDAVLLAALFVGVDVCTSWAAARRRGGWVALGALPFAAYLLANRYWFHVWLPISGEAKQLRFHHWPALRPLLLLLTLRSVPLQATIWLALAFTAVALFHFRKSKLPLTEKRFAAVLLVFPFLQLAVLCTLSDWPLWPWYLYPFVLALYGAAMILLPLYPVRWEARLMRTQALLYAGVLAFAAALLYVPRAAWLRYEDNRQIAAYMNAHPGTYAMGDVSGMLSVMTDEPMVQTEGLMEDRAYLAAMRRREFLGDLLRRYGAVYYIADPGQAADTQSYVVVEPIQAGPDSPTMRGFVCGDKAVFRPGRPAVHQIFAVREIARSAPVACGGTL